MICLADTRPQAVVVWEFSPESSELWVFNPETHTLLLLFTSKGLARMRR
jgi:hypothetical protein